VVNPQATKTDGQARIKVLEEETHQKSERRLIPAVLYWNDHYASELPSVSPDATFREHGRFGGEETQSTFTRPGNYSSTSTRIAPWLVPDLHWVSCIPFQLLDLFFLVSFLGVIRICPQEDLEMRSCQILFISIRLWSGVGGPGGLACLFAFTTICYVWEACPTQPQQSVCGSGGHGHRFALAYVWSMV